jgi:release factor glutamine methyltransferase
VRRSIAAARTQIDAVDARLLLGHALGVSREYLATHPDRILTAEEAALFEALVARRIEGEPIAYLIGRREFYGRQFHVTPAVLIPRPETELLVEAALERMPQHALVNVLDLGTGSGAVAVTLACERLQVRLYGVDASQSALDLAFRNASSHLGSGWASRTTLVLGDWYAPFADRRFHLIVANPPYVAEGDVHLAQGDVRFEPRQALVSGADGLAALRVIVAGAPAHLASGGWLICEHGYDQAEAVATLFRDAGFTDIFCRDDLAGIPRITGGRLA